MSKLTQNTVSQIIEMSLPSEDGKYRLTFTLDVRDGVALGLNFGGIFKGSQYIGSFSGLIGFNHNVIGEDVEAVEALLSTLQDALVDYGVPKPVALPEPAETEEETAQEGE